MRLPASLCLLLLIFINIVPASAQTASSTSPGWVVLPVNEYTALKRAASTSEPEPLPPPVEATLSRSITISRSTAISRPAKLD